MAQAKQRSPGSAERPSLEGFPTVLTGADKAAILQLTKRFGVDFLRLQFTDILGVNKNVEVPPGQFEKALDGEIMFDGSSMKDSSASKNPTCCSSPISRRPGSCPYDDEGGRVARFLCDIYRPRRGALCRVPADDAQTAACPSPRRWASR